MSPSPDKSLDLLLIEDSPLAIMVLLEVFLFLGEVRNKVLLLDLVLNLNIEQ